MSFAVGSLVKAREREWVVLPESDDELLMVRPLGGTEDESTGICSCSGERAAGDVRSAQPGATGRLAIVSAVTRCTLALGFPLQHGPFRSFARLGFEPRPYQARSAADGGETRRRFGF